ncbi:MAG: FRG domain-containing protein [Eubacterium sp.]|nr:FRG domain-containing protein [Eubacterium sp.]
MKKPSYVIARCTVESLQQFDEIITECKKYYKDLYENKYPHLIYCYRGQKRAGWELTPSIARNIANNSGGLQKYESNLIKAFRDKSILSTDNSRITINNIMEAQHHGIPTRMLDVTTCYYVALWFACEYCLQSNGKASDGEVFIIPCLNERNKDFEEYIISQIEDYDRITKLSPEEFQKELNKHGIEKHRGMKPFEVVNYSELYKYKRIENQQGHGILVPMKNYESKGTKRIVNTKYSHISKCNMISIKIKAKSKDAIRKSLNEKKPSINEAFLFENDLEHLGKYITDTYIQKAKE